MIEYREREAMKTEASRIVHDPDASTDARAQALLLWAQAHYWRAREHLDEAPLSLRRAVYGRPIHRGYQLELDLYTRHWLAAVAPMISGAACLVPLVGEQYGYLPERCACLPPGRSIYVNPMSLPESDRWPEPNMRPPRKGKASQLLRRGDVVRLKVRTIGGFKGIGVVTTDMAHRGAVVRFVRMGMDLREIPSTACRHEVALIGELACETDCQRHATVA